MSDYIRREDAIDAATQDSTENRTHSFRAGQARSASRIKALPAADVAPVVHGKWTKLSYDGFNCNKCGSTFVIMQGREDMHFCPNCGAKMDGDMYG